MKGTEKQVKWAQDIIARISADADKLDAIATGAQPIMCSWALKRGEKLPDGVMDTFDAIGLIEKVGDIGADFIPYPCPFDYIGMSIAIKKIWTSLDDVDGIKAAAAQMAALVRDAFEKVTSASAWINLKNY